MLLNNAMVISIICIDCPLIIRMEPENGAHFCNRGVCLSKLKKFGMAVEDFDFAIQLDPSPANYFSRGTTFSDYGKYELAVQGNEWRDLLFLV